MNLPGDIQHEIYACLPKRREAAMLFGSVARGDMVPESDIDVLVLTSGKTGTSRCGRVNLSCYTPTHLSKMAHEGSLFVRHLIMDGLVIEDAKGILAECLSKYVRPSSYATFHQALCSVLPLFDINQSRFTEHAQGFVDVAMFCLRTAVYVRADQQDILSFSLGDLEVQTGWPEVTLLRRIKRDQPTGSWRNFQDLVTALESELGSRAANPALTPEAYVTNVYDKHPIVLALALRLLSGANVPMNYDLLSPLALVS